MDIEALARLHSQHGSLISVYLNRPPGASAAAITDALKPLRSDLFSRSRAVTMSVRADLDRIAGLAPKIETISAPAFAIFASEADDIFELLALPQEVWEHTSVGWRPYLRPLRALPEQLRAGVVVAERSRALLYVADDGDLAALGDPIVTDLGKGNFGGFKGYAEQRSRAHADEESARIFREAASRLLEEHQRSPFDFISVGGHQESVDEIAGHLHPYLRALPVHEFIVDLHTLTSPELSHRVAALAERVRAARDEEAVRTVLEAVHTEAPSARGTVDVLRAATARAISLLVVAGTFSKPGVRCFDCGWMARSGSSCPVCGRPPEQVDDVVAEAIESVVASGGEARQVSVASPLDADGVAAALRFPV